MANNYRYKIVWKRVFLLIAVLIFLGLAGTGLFHYVKDYGLTPWPPAGQGDPSPGTDPAADPGSVDITIAAVGDILIHNTLYFGAYQPDTETYDFSHQFIYVKPYLENADITLANLETTLSGPERGYSGYPKFNTPDEVADALKGTGVDIITAANNHRLDQGIAGFYRTIRVARQKGLDIIGVKAEEKEKTYVIKDIKGVKVAFLNFGYGYPQENGSLDINGLILPMELTGLIDTFDPQNLESSIAKITGKIKNAREDGAEVVVICLHWGAEYAREPNDFQQKLAAAMAELGADVIFGGHPHVLQPALYLTTSQGKKVPVFYSLGNFISDQREETVNNIYTEQGLIAKVTLRIHREGGSTGRSAADLPTVEAPSGAEAPSPRVEVLSCEAIATWVNKKIIDSRYHYEVIPAAEALQSPEKFPLLRAADLGRIRFCLDTVKGLTEGI